jgi:hypothetical protein
MKNSYLLVIKWVGRHVGSLLLSSVLPVGAVLAQPTITAVTPKVNALATPASGSVTTTFSQPLTATSGGALQVYSAQRGGWRTRGTQVATVSGNTLTFTPSDYAFAAGERVDVTVTRAAASSSGSLARAQVRQFTTAVGGSGRGTFTYGATTGIHPAYSPTSLAAGDLDGDGDLDIVCTPNNATVNLVYMWLNNGSGVYSSAPSVATAGNPSNVTLADVDGDGDLDILAISTLFYTGGGSVVSVRLNNGAGVFSGNQEVAAGSSLNGLAVGDVDGDGDLDLVVPNYVTAGTATVCLNNGSGTFTKSSNVSVDTKPSVVVLGDIDSDGDLDLLTGSYGGGVSVRLNDGSGTFSGTRYVATGSYPFGLTLGDVDGDGDLDLAATNSLASTVQVRLNNGSGIFGGGQSVDVGLGFNHESEPYGVVLADMDADGDLDLFSANSKDGAVAVRLNNGKGTFSGSTSQYVSVGYNPTRVVMADVDGDRDLDMLVGNHFETTLSIIYNRESNQAPTLTAVSPGSGAAGSLITLTGTNLTGATAVSFNGTAATTFTVVNATTVTATVPTGATSGNVTVTTPSGTTGGILFTVTYPDLVVNTTTTIPAGTYNSITVTSTGAGTLAGNVTVNTSFTVQSGGTLTDGCAIISGTGSFTLAAGATLSICAAQGIATSGASGTVQVTGPRSFSPDASYVYNGSAAQVTGDGLPSQVRNLSITNTQNVTLSQGVAIAQVLTISDRGSLIQPSAAASITLLSDATAGTALMVNKSSGFLDGPTTTIQRAIDGSTNAGSGYRHFAPPVYGATIGDLTTAGFTPVVNSLYNTQGASVQPFPTVYFYEESRVSDTGVPGSGFDKGWVSPDDLTDQLFNAIGYTLQLPATAKLSVTGRVFNNGGVGHYLYRTGSDADAGWSLVGNPYASPIDWRLVTASDRAGLDAAMYVFESTGPYTGSYRSYANGIGGNPIIPLGQAFFVRVSSGQTQGLMFFQGSQRVTTFDAATSFKRTTADPRPQLALSLSDATLHDITYLYQEAGATTGVDAEYDAVKMPNSNGLNVSQLASNAKLAINGLPTLTATTSVPLVVGVPAAGTYTLALTTLNNLPAGLDAYLRDAQTGRTVKLATGGSYRFDVTATQAATPVLGRFTLLFSPATPLATAPALAPELVGIYPNPAHGSFTVTVPTVTGATQVHVELVNALGQVLRQQSAALPASGASFVVPATGLAAGVYVLRLQAGNTTLTKRVVIQ